MSGAQPNASLFSFVGQDYFYPAVLGEKMVLAVCESASISTTKGIIVFEPTGRTEKPRQKRERGSVFQGRIKMTREEYPLVCDYLRSLLLPEIDRKSTRLNSS